MAAGLHGPTEIIVTIEDGPGGTARTMSGFIRSGVEIGHIAETAETTGFGDAFREHVPTGIKTHDPIELTLLFDDTATTGVHATLGTVDDGPQDDGREVVITVANTTVTYTVDVRLTKYTVSATLEGVQMANVSLLPTGTGTWA